MRSEKDMLFDQTENLPGMQFVAGWYRFASSSKITQGKVHSFTYFDKEFVSYRNSHGEVFVYDAYCPHLGAHLGMGGKIKEDKLVCPFHGWTYHSSGKCVDIPYCKIIPKRAALKSYRTKEIHSTVYIYYDPATTVDDIVLVDIDHHPLQNLYEHHYKKYLELHMPQADYEALITSVTFQQHGFKSYAAGYYIACLNNEIESKNIQLLLTATPINEQSVHVVFSAAYQYTFNPLRNLSVRARIMKLLAAVNVI
jgi:nitrite reductase/ring-hydroxylating ferredoxin subunit